MRVNVKKFLFLGIAKQQETFFKKAQELGVIEFIGHGRLEAMQDSEIQEFVTAIKILRAFPVLEQVERTDWHHAPEVARKVFQLHHELHQMQEKHRWLVVEKERVEIFGHFSFEDLAAIEKESGYHLFFYLAKQGKFTETPPSLIWIGEQRGFDHFVAISKEPIKIEGLLECHVTKTAQMLQEEISALTTEMTLKESLLKAHQAYDHFLHAALVRLYNHVHREHVQQSLAYPLEGQLFASQGWVPTTKIAEVHALAAELHMVAEEVKIEEPHLIPTYLENQGNQQIGQDLVAIYDTPSIADKDPSGWVLWAFILFFAMIINDAGYGLLFLIGTLIWKKVQPPPSALGKRMIKLSLMLSSACILWGVFTSSFFGIEVHPEHPWRTLSFVDGLVNQKIAYHLKNHDAVYQEWVKENPTLAHATTVTAFSQNKALAQELANTIAFEFALIIGTLHVILSMARNLRRHWASFGWILFMVGCYLYLPSFLHATSLINILSGYSPDALATIGQQLLWTGLGVAILLALIQKRLSGVLEVMTVIQIFCDVLSYLRLYALGLAGMMMAATFNDMAASSGPFFGILILLVGHSVNMVMGIMGGVIHGLRLNFLEWYHYSFEGGGREFRPLKWIEPN